MILRFTNASRFFICCKSEIPKGYRRLLSHCLKGRNGRNGEKEVDEEDEGEEKKEWVNGPNGTDSCVLLGLSL